MKITSTKYVRLYIACFTSIALFVVLAFQAIGAKTPTVQLTRIIFSNDADNNDNKLVSNLIKSEITRAESLPGADKVVVSTKRFDINSDGSEDLFAYVEQYPYFCGDNGCSLYVFIAEPNNKWKMIVESLITHDIIFISSHVTNNFRDIVLENNRTWFWDGQKYETN